MLADEADSALDTEAYLNFLNTIDEFGGKIYIMVTHKIDDGLKKFDEILVMDRGKLIESGNYEELLKKKGYFYNELYRKTRAKRIENVS